MSDHQTPQAGSPPLLKAPKLRLARPVASKATVALPVETSFLVLDMLVVVESEQAGSHERLVVLVAVPHEMERWIDVAAGWSARTAAPLSGWRLEWGSATAEARMARMRSSGQRAPT